MKTNLERGQRQSDSLIIPYLEDIKSQKVVNPYELQLTLAKRNYVLPLVFGGKVGMMVSPKAIKDNVKGLATQPVGAGPFELTNYTAPTSATRRASGSIAQKARPRPWPLRPVAVTISASGYF